MQKRALLKKNAPKRYETVFAPLPAKADDMLYVDKGAVCLPYAEDFPRLHYHDRYEVGICEEGEGLFLWEGRFLSIAKGDLVLIAPGQRHYSRSLRESEPCRCRFVYVGREAVEEIASPTECAGRIPAVIHGEEYPEAAALLRELVALCVEGLPQRERSAVLRLSILLLEADRWFPTPEQSAREGIARCGAPDPIVSALAEYLSLHYGERQTAGELACMYHISESQLRRKFLSAYGMPPIAYRNVLRCRVASELFVRTVLSVGQISDRVGYSAPSEFYRSFRRLYGMAPTDYRKQKKCENG